MHKSYKVTVEPHSNIWDTPHCNRLLVWHDNNELFLHDSDSRRLVWSILHDLHVPIRADANTVAVDDWGIDLFGRRQVSKYTHSPELRYRHRDKPGKVFAQYRIITAGP